LPLNRKPAFIKSGLFCLVLALSCTVKAQYSLDTVPNSLLKDTLRPKVDWSVQPKKGFPVKAFIVPATMITYGILSMHTDALQDWNEKVKAELTEHPHDRVHLDNYLQYSPAVAVFGLQALGIKGKHNFRDCAMIYLLSSMIMTSSVFSVKALTKEGRPDNTSYQSAYESFPSGHTANAFASAEFLRMEYKDVSPWYGIAGYGAAIATGCLRMYNNRHWLGDVVAGAGFGIASTRLAYLIYPAIKRKLFKDKEMHTMVMPMYQNGSVGLGLVYNFH
jgi:hypothetical protein